MIFYFFLISNKRISTSYLEITNVYVIYSLEAKALAAGIKNNVNSNIKDNTLEGLLGGVPHTIRGSLWGYESYLTITHRFSSCTACSIPLISEYQKRGFEFILDACNIPNYLEKLCGLEELLKRPDLDEVRETIV